MISSTAEQSFRLCAKASLFKIMIHYYTTPLEGVWELIPDVYSDSRGSFAELLRMEEFYAKTSSQPLVQENESFSQRGVLRGMHLQHGEASQAKLVRCVYGRVLDVIVDLRQGSPSFAQHLAILLDSEKKNRLFVPRGFAHGFLTLSKEAVFHYLVDAPYAPKSEIGITPFDSSLHLEWDQWLLQYDTLSPRLSAEALILSDKDRRGISLNDYLTKLKN